MGDIGRAVGISGPAIYKHFSGKDEILATLLNDAIDEIMARTRSDPDPVVELHSLLRSQAEFAVTHRELVSVYTRDDRELGEPWRRHFQRRAQKHEEHWLGVLKRCYPEVPEQSIIVAAHALLGMIHSVGRSPRDLDDHAAIDTLEKMAKASLQGLGKQDDRVAAAPAATGDPTR